LSPTPSVHGSGEQQQLKQGRRRNPRSVYSRELRRGEDVFRETREIVERAKQGLSNMGFEEMAEMNGTCVVNRWGLSLRIVGTARVVVIGI
jgi:hypothetical protein